MVAVAGRQKSNRRHAATKKGYSLPIVVDPPETLCVCVPVPDDQFHRAAFLGQLYALGRAFTWGNDAEHTALGAAEVWYSIFINVRDQMALQPRNCGCSDDKIYRFDENGNLESSSDGGATWELAPGDDPRLTAPLFPPLPGEDSPEKKCVAANNATAQIKQSCDQLIADSGLWSSLTLLISAVTAILVFLSIFGSGGLLTPLIVGAAGSLLGFGSAAFAAAMTEDVYETLCCIIYCSMDNSGTVSGSGWQEIKSDIGAQLTGIAATHLTNVVNIMGANGLTNAGRTSGLSMDIDCTTCDCVPTCEDPDRFFNGTVLSQVENPDGSTTFTVQSVQPGIANTIDWGEIGSTECCCIIDMHVIDGACSGEATYWSLCGEPTVNNGTTYPPDPLGYFAFQQNGCFSQQFTIEITFQGCP